ncbi:hypothetical protein CYMTET_17768 [Cymbomonas tetramitiformis]|uniref:Reverse transcriptase domain-containing protein n=1 Tax=Cymbomonas tetramitiformis TaxID=36881 RepID=A0AAE0GAS7_9CHLO|nr:hypothetical protein CYMTET_17768 [Cymbomonas tetramitiformis]
MAALARMRVDPGDAQAHKAAAVAPCSKFQEWLEGARVVAVLKDDLGVNIRPIACGEVLWKLEAKVSAAIKGGVDLKSREGAQQGDPLGPLYLAASLQTVLEQVQEGHSEVIADLDDVLLMGPPLATAGAYDPYDLALTFSLLSRRLPRLGEPLFLFGCLEHKGA